MAASSVVTLGYSVSGGYQGGTATLPTLGYDIGEVVVSDVEGLEARATGKPLHARAGGDQLHGRAKGDQLHATAGGE